MDFRDGFFEEEEYDGFRIAPMMKRAWAAELKMLSIVDKICRDHGIRYFADYGTLIGAVRHHGFIPWDDDIDICMLRADYMRFLAVAKQELPEPCIIHSYFVREDHDQPFSVVMNRETVGRREDPITKEFYDCPFVVGVEIYPLDYIPRDGQEFDVVKALFGYVYDCGMDYNRYEEDGTLTERIAKIQENTGVTLGQAGIPMAQEIRQLADRLAMMYTAEESDYLAIMFDFAVTESPILREKAWYADETYLPFENTMIPVPVGYDAYLSKKYGDYMTPSRYENHEYPFYKVQYAGLSNEDYEYYCTENLL